MKAQRAEGRGHLAAVVHASAFCSSLFVFSFMFGSAVRGANAEQRTPNAEPNLNTNREVRTPKRELHVNCPYASLSAEHSSRPSTISSAPRRSSPTGAARPCSRSPRSDSSFPPARTAAARTSGRTSAGPGSRASRRVQSKSIMSDRFGSGVL